MCLESALSGRLANFFKVSPRGDAQMFGLTTPEINRDLDDFYGPLNAEFHSLLL